MGLKKWQRNAVFEAIRAAGLSPEEFDLEHSEDESILRHGPSGASFAFEGVAGNYATRYSAGDAPVEERTGLSQFRMMQQVEFWLGALRPDIDTPDLWAQLQSESRLLGAVSDEAVENTPLSPSEQEEIAEQLRELTAYVRRVYSLSDLQMRLLEERLDYVAAATSRVGRKDWLLIATGMMLSYVLEAALPPDAARDVLGTLLTSIGHILGQVPRGLPGG